MKLFTTICSFYCLFWLLLQIMYTSAWDNEDMEIYDVVEEIGQNFYKLLGVTQDTSTADIRRAYRRLSLQLHPDKNKEEGAEDRFRRMVSVYEILKDDNKRQKYNQVLEHGLPDWRQPVFYFRKARKITLVECLLLLFVIGAVGQYLVLWAQHFEKRLSLEDFFSTKRRRTTKRKKDGYSDPDDQLEELLATLPRPTFTQLYPWQLICLVGHVTVSLPTYVQNFREYWRERQELKRLELESPDTDDEVEEIEYVRPVRKRQKPVLPEYSGNDDVTPVMYMQIRTDVGDEGDKQDLKTGNWTDDELSLLAKGVAKYPGGTFERWMKISRYVGRSVDEVIEKTQELRQSKISHVSLSAQGTTGTHVASLKKGQTISDDIISTNYGDQNESNTSRKSTKQPSNDTTIAGNKTSKIPVTKTKNTINTGTASSRLDGSKNVKSSNSTNDDQSKGASSIPSDNWTQNQQVILEWALKQYPRTCEDRWGEISAHIPGKSKDECLQRFKHLAEMLKQRKQQKST